MFSCIPFISCNISYSFRADKPWTRLTPEDKVILFIDYFFSCSTLLTGFLRTYGTVV